MSPLASTFSANTKIMAAPATPTLTAAIENQQQAEAAPVRQHIPGSAEPSKKRGNRTEIEPR